MIADSCALVVYFRDPRAPATMPNAYPHMQGAYVPPLIVLELERLIARGRLPPLPTPLPVLLRARGFQYLPMTWEVSARASGLPPIHKDPTDRALVAHAIEQKMPILTSDATIPAYGVTTIW